jgi:predicted DNA-binding transcriptional regulator AlpA
MTRLELVPLVQAGEVGRGLSWPGWLHTFEVERAKGRYPDLIGPVDISDEAIGQSAELRSAEAKPALPNNSAAIIPPKSATVSRRAGGKLADTLAYPPRIFRSDRAAAYLSMSESQFLKLVAQGRLPKGKRLGGITFWDRAMLDAFVDNYQGEVDDSTVADEWAKMLRDK